MLYYIWKITHIIHVCSMKGCLLLYIRYMFVLLCVSCIITLYIVLYMISRDIMYIMTIMHLMNVTVIITVLVYYYYYHCCCCFCLLLLLYILQCTVDGQWTNWTEWSVCDKTCGTGHSVRIRRCANPPPLYHGKPCEGTDIETQSCNENECPGRYFLHTFLFDAHEWVLHCH